MAEGCAEPLAAKGLSKRYRGQAEWALKDIEVSFREGAITALIGPNGAGKSTLLRTFMGFEVPTRGRALVCGMEARKQRGRALANVGYVGQEAPLYRDLTVRDHLALAAVLRRRFDQTGSSLRLKDLGIPLSARIGQLSGGQRAQVALTIALGTTAPILLLDEPIASLDPIARLEFLATLAGAVSGTGRTVVIASHIIGELDGVCDDLVVLAPSKVVLHDRIDEARRSHFVVPAEAAPTGSKVVATWPRPGRGRVSLVQGANGDGAALEDVVLGYLAAGRAHTSA